MNRGKLLSDFNLPKTLIRRIFIQPNYIVIRQIAQIQQISNSKDVLNRNNILKKRISQISERTKIYSNTEQKVFSTKERKKDDNQQSYGSAAQEIYSSITNSYDGLMELANKRLNPISFSSIHLEPESKFNNIDLKRHQHYFNQMMNFDTPSGSWIDLNS